jgi:hypothetical protein
MLLLLLLLLLRLLLLLLQRGNGRGRCVASEKRRTTSEQSLKGSRRRSRLRKWLSSGRWSGRTPRRLWGRMLLERRGARVQLRHRNFTQVHGEARRRRVRVPWRIVELDALQPGGLRVVHDVLVEFFG